MAFRNAASKSRRHRLPRRSHLIQKVGTSASNATGCTDSATARKPRSQSAKCHKRSRLAKMATPTPASNETANTHAVFSTISMSQSANWMLLSSVRRAGTTAAAKIRTCAAQFPVHDPALLQNLSSAITPRQLRAVCASRERRCVPKEPSFPHAVHPPPPVPQDRKYVAIVRQTGRLCVASSPYLCHLRFSDRSRAPVPWWVRTVSASKERRYVRRGK